MKAVPFLVPTFSSVFEVAPPPHLQFERNGWNYSAASAPDHSSERIFIPEVLDVDRYMGVIPATALACTNHARGNHPLDSFTAVGPQAAKLIGGQAPLDVYAPLAALYFNLCSFELSGRLYERLGVRQFKRFASAGDFFNRRRRRSDPGFRNVKNYSSAIEWEARTRFNELAHVCNLIFNLAMLVWLCLQARYTWIGPLVFLNLILNVYPIMLQRYNRARIQRIRLFRR